MSAFKVQALGHYITLLQGSKKQIWGEQVKAVDICREEGNRGCVRLSISQIDYSRNMAYIGSYFSNPSAQVIPVPAVLTLC